MRKDKPLINFKNLDDQELRRLISSWRAQAARGSDEAPGIIYAFEAEMTRRRIFSSVRTNDPTFN